MKKSAQFAMTLEILLDFYKVNHIFKMAASIGFVEIPFPLSFLSVKLLMLSYPSVLTYV